MKYFVYLKCQLIIYNDIKNGRITLQKEEKIQEKFRTELNEILKGSPNYKSKDLINIIKKVKKLYNEREEVLDFYNNYARMVSDAKCKSIHGEGLNKKGLKKASEITNSTCTSKSRWYIWRLTITPHRLLFNLLDKINLKRSDKYVALSNIST